MITAHYDKERITSTDDGAEALYNQSRYGSLKKGKVTYSALEAYYLTEKGKLTVLDGRGTPYEPDRLWKALKRKEAHFFIRYQVFRDLRQRGYIVKTAFKFGADFRVYDRGVKPGEDHAKWIAYPVHETSRYTWHAFSAKNRVAHSTKKRLLICVVDDEGDVTYYEIKWVRP